MPVIQGTFRGPKKSKKANSPLMLQYSVVKNKIQLPPEAKSCFTFMAGGYLCVLWEAGRHVSPSVSRYHN